MLYPEFTMQEEQLLDSRMAMRRIRGVRRETHQHADPVWFCICGQQLAGDAGCNVRPFGFTPCQHLG
ncbi:MAG TPA: hypothetical protein VFA39_13530 [Steroidobacteraceae bacterium]|nr:hypothetical protein [Steroidobacteraceae bacterium]